MRGRGIATALVIVWMIVIFLFSAMPGEESGDLSLAVGENVCRVFVPGYEEMPKGKQLELAGLIDHPVRKCAHVTEYAILGILLVLMFWQYGVRGWRLIRRSLIAGMAYAISDEFHQLFVAERSGQGTDVFIDTFGVAVGVFVCIGVYRIVRKYCLRRHLGSFER